MSEQETRVTNYIMPKRYRRRPFHKAHDLLKSTFKKFGLDKEIGKYEFILFWKDIVGAEIAKRSKPLNFKGTTLMIQVVDSAWAQELSYHKPVIISRLKKYLDDPSSLQDIHFVVGAVS